MGSIWVRQFTGGLDTRRLSETTPGGSLIRATDGHITPGGEFEKRAAFVDTYDLPAGTIGLYHVKTGIVVFGSVSTPGGIPVGVTYQRLQHPDGTTAMTALLSADLYQNKIYAAAQFADGTIEHYYDGTRVTAWFDGRARASFRVTGGVASDTMTSLQVNGINILNGTITWGTSNVAVAALIAASVNAATSSPDYSATSVGDQVNIIAALAGTAANALPVTAVLTGAFAIAPGGGLFTAGGSDATDTYTPGGFVRTIGSKIYAPIDTALHFSGIEQPTKFSSDVTGAGFIDTSLYDSESNDLKSVANYQTFIAIFAGRTIQIWYVDSDPALNRKSQILKNTGTESPRSVTEVGNTDVYYLDESGVRSLRSVAVTGSITTTDIGTPINGLVTALLETFSETDRLKIIGLINPVDGRFWMCLGGTILVLSRFDEAKISAWTQYLPGFTIDDATVWNRRVYVRSGDKIYVFGGKGAMPTYDATSAEAWLPYMEAGQPTQEKQWEGIDAAVRGTWSVGVGMDPTEDGLLTEDAVATISKTTYPDDRIPFDGKSTHASMRFRSQGTGKAVLSAAVLHYVGDLSLSE